MIPKEVTDALKDLHCWSECWLGGDDADVVEQINIIKDFLNTSDRYIRDLEQHVDDLVAGNHGLDDD